MKQILYSICIGSLALALAASGEAAKPKAQPKAKARVTKVQKAGGGSSVRSTGKVRTQHSVSSPRFSQNSYHGTRTSGSSVKNAGRVRTQHTLSSAKVSSSAGVRHERNISASNQVRARNARNNVATNRERNLSVNRKGNFNANGAANVATNRGRGVNRNVTVNDNWRSSQFSGQNYAPFRNYSRTYHNRNWWRSNYPRITFYFGAPYYWDAGYWYPAWGYYPNYVYQYDGPIYGYNGLAPDRVVVDVQIQLRRDGYYTGAIDGVLGPMTRRAITAFQVDNGLAVTSSIDEPTLATLGVG